MASFAETIFGGAQKAISENQPDVLGSIKTGAELAARKQQLEQQKLQLEQQKEVLQFNKVSNLTDTIEKGLTKVPKKARSAYFKNFVLPQAQQLGVPVDQSFIDSLQSDDVDTASVVNAMAEFRGAIRNAYATGNFDLSPAAREAGATIMEAMGGDVTKFAPYTNTAYNAEAQSFAQGQRAKAQEQTAKVARQKDVREQADSLRKELTAHPTSKNTFALRDAYNRVEQLKKGTAASDLGGIFAYMKMLDPGSTVREGEFANAQNAAGVPEKIINYYNNIRSGTRLTPAQREQFMSEAGDLLAKQEKQQAALNRQFEGIARSTPGVNVENVFAGTNLRLQSAEKRKDKEAPPPDKVELAIKQLISMGTAKADKIRAFAKSKGLSEDRINKLLQGYAPKGQ